MHLILSDARWRRLCDKIKRQGVMGRPWADDRGCLTAFC
jgi:hypothetical protein